MPVIFANRDPEWYQERYIDIRGVNQQGYHYPDLEAYTEQLERDYDSQQNDIGHMQDTIDRLTDQVESYERTFQQGQEAQMAVQSNMPPDGRSDF